MGKRITQVSELTKVGGKALVDKYGKDHMAIIGAKGNEAMKRLGKDFYKARAKKIAEARRRNRQTPAERVVNLLIGK